MWNPAPAPPAAEELVATGLPPWLATLLARRGVHDAAGAQRFLAPAPEHLHDPYLLAGMEPAVARLLTAQERGEKVAVVGDYDVDGVTATALLVAVFRACGLEAEPILPHRLTEGYGFQPVHVERAQQLDCHLILTADCGTSAGSAVAAARTAGLDVVITDHHLPGEEALPADTLQINPKQPGCTYPDPNLSGAGLAFKLAVAFAERRGRPLELSALLRIACLGTIADLVPLTGENRVIAALGLAAMSGVRSPGLRALIDQAGVKMPCSAADVGFRLGPRLNAAGRLGSADLALELLLSRDLGRARELARQLDDWNRQRQQEEDVVVEDARQRVLERGELPAILVAWDPGWHRGVVGIAAGRLAREFHRPTLLLSVDGDTATGSGRSIPDLPLHSFLAPWEDQLERFGGHSQAVGLTVATDRLEELRSRWEQAAAEAWPPELLRRRYQYELELAPSQVNEDLQRQLARLEPYGQGNSRPLVRVGPLEPAAPPRAFGRNHLSLSARGDDGSRVQLLGWRWQPRQAELTGRFEVLAHLERDDYRQSVMLELVDCRRL